MFPNNMEVSSLVINITTKGPDLKSSLRVSSQISSKHTYLPTSSQWEFTPEIWPISILKSRFLTGVIICTKKASIVSTFKIHVLTPFK